MGCSYTALINKNNRRNKNGKHSILIRVTLDRKSKYFNLGERIDEKFWSGKENRWIKDSHPSAFEINTIIKKKLDLLHKYEYRQKVFGNSVSLEGIADFFYKKADPNVFNDYLEEFLAKCLRGKALNTHKKYRTFARYLHTFNPRLSFSQLNENIFHDFAQSLSKKGLSGISIDKYFDAFKVVAKQAVKDGYLEKDPFQYFKLDIKSSRSKRIYLEIDEITKLKNIKLPPGRIDLAVARECWLFCFYAGFYYSDLRKLTWDKVKKTSLGYCIVGNRHKNESEYIAPVHKFPNAITLLDRQAGKDKEYVFPGLISEQKYNQKLKELAKLAGIEKKLMNKSARHSNIQFWEAQGLETQHTAKMVGHSKESTTKQYYELSTRDINARVDRFDFSSLDL